MNKQNGIFREVHPEMGPVSLPGRGHNRETDTGKKDNRCPASEAISYLRPELSEDRNIYSKAQHAGSIRGSATQAGSGRNCLIQMNSGFRDLRIMFF